MTELAFDTKQPALQACAGRKVSCTNCCMRKLCIVAGMHSDQMEAVDQLVEHWHPSPRGRHIIREGDQFRQILIVRSGAIKAYQTLENGDEQITDFILPGDVFGMDGLATGRHIAGAIALETTSVCAIPMQCMLESTGLAKAAEHQVLALFSESLNRKDAHVAMISMNKSHERVAAFLLDISARLARRKLSSSHFVLSMNRSDISRYLALSQESVSRAFAKLTQAGILACSGRQVDLLDFQALSRYAGRTGPADLQQAG